MNLLFLVHVLWVMPQADVARQLTIHPNTEQDLVLLYIILLKNFKLQLSTEQMRLVDMATEMLI